MKANIYLIAEIGINHNGDLKIAKELIWRSKNAGFDAVKFQKRDLNSVYSQEYLESFRENYNIFKINSTEFYIQF